VGVHTISVLVVAPVAFAFMNRGVPAGEAVVLEVAQQTQALAA